MKRQFTIPVMCAVLFHAALLLGSRHEPATAQLSDNNKAEPHSTPVDPFLDQPVIELETDNADKPVKWGNTDESGPTTPEPPSKPTPAVFPMETVPVPPARKIAVGKIPVGVIGMPEGSPDGLILDGGVFDPAMLDNPPRTTAQIAPIYPAEARMRGYSGEVVVGFLVNESGRVSSPYVIGSTDPLFNDAAMRAVGKWRFEPGRHGGKAVSFKMSVPIVFNLN
jgi:periplasmic protein TonB